MAYTSTPTETQYATVVTSSEAVTFTESVTTIPPQVTVVVSTSQCPATPSGGGTVGGGGGLGDDGCTPELVTVTSTVDAGGENTMQVPVQLTVKFTMTFPTSTLFDTCPSPDPDLDSTVPTDPPPTDDPLSASPSSTLSPTSPFTPSAIPVPSTMSLPPTITSTTTPFVPSVPTTPPNGSVTLPFISVMPSSQSSPGSGPPPNGHMQDNPDHANDTNGILAPVVGGVLGGFFGFIGIVALVWFLWSRRERMFRNAPPLDPDLSYYSPPIQEIHEPEPKPYYYGLVGRASSHPSRGSSPPSTTPPPSAFPYANASLSSGQHRHSSPSPSPSPVPYPQGSNPSLSLSMGSPHSAAITPAFFAPTALTPGPSQSSSRPSTAGNGDFFAQQQQQLQSLPPGAAQPMMRQSWPRYGDDPDSHSPRSSQSSSTFQRPGHNSSPGPPPRPERRQSRLSLTLANYNPTDGDMPDPTLRMVGDGGGSSAAAGDSGVVGEDEKMRRSSSTKSDTAPGLPERRQIVLYVVN